MGKPGKDCWGYPDGFASPDNGGLLSETQNVTVNADGSRTVHDLGIKLMKYMAKCALPAGDKISLLDYTGNVVQFSGSLGLAPQWKTDGCSDIELHPGKGTCQQNISACLMALTNGAGRHHAARAVFHEERSRRRPRRGISVPRGRLLRQPVRQPCSDRRSREAARLLLQGLEPG